MIFVVTKMVIISEFVDRFFHFRPQCVLHLGREVGWWRRPQRGWFLLVSFVGFVGLTWMKLYGGMISVGVLCKILGKLCVRSDHCRASANGSTGQVWAYRADEDSSRWEL